MAYTLPSLGDYKAIYDSYDPLNLIFGDSGSSSASDASSSTSLSDEGVLSGYLSSVGEQNQLDRDFNSSEALAQRSWQEIMLRAQMDYNSAEAVANREWQSKESELSRFWQQAMSDTSFSRAVSDLRRAGLNPILAAQRAGASTGSGGMATGGSAASVAPVTGAAASSNGSRGVDLVQMVSALGSLMSGAGNLIGQFLTKKVSTKSNSTVNSTVNSYIHK